MQATLGPGTRLSWPALVSPQNTTRMKHKKQLEENRKLNKLVSMCDRLELNKSTKHVNTIHVIDCLGFVLQTWLLVRCSLVSYWNTQLCTQLHYCIVLNFQGSKFLRIVIFEDFVETISWIRCAYTLHAACQKFSLKYFHKRLKIHEIKDPQNFSTIQYVSPFPSLLKWLDLDIGKWLTP